MPPDRHEKCPSGLGSKRAGGEKGQPHGSHAQPERQVETAADVPKQAKRPGWGRVPRWTLGHLKFSRAAAAVYLVLATHANRNWLAWPSIKTIAELTGLKRRTVSAVLHALADKSRKLIAVEHRGGGRRADGTGITTVYRLLTDDNSAPTDTVNSAPRRSVNGAVADRATVQKTSKKGAPRCAGTYKEQTAATEAAHAAAAAGDELTAELTDALQSSGIGNPARDRLSRTPGVTVDLVRREAARIEGTGKGPPILIENIETAAAKSIAHGETASRDRADTEAKAQCTADKLTRLAAANAVAKELIQTISDDRVAELHKAVLDTCPQLKRDVWRRADPRKHQDLMREIARIARKGESVGSVLTC